MLSHYRWRDVIEELPEEYKLVEIIDEFGNKQRAWLDVDKWDFGKYKLKGRVIAWRYERMQYY